MVVIFVRDCEVGALHNLTLYFTTWLLSNKISNIHVHVFQWQLNQFIQWSGLQEGELRQNITQLAFYLNLYLTVIVIGCRDDDGPI